VNDERLDGATTTAPPGRSRAATPRGGAALGPARRSRAARWAAAAVVWLLWGLLHLLASCIAVVSWIGENRPYGDSESGRAAIVAMFALGVEAVAAPFTWMLTRLTLRGRAWTRWLYLSDALLVGAALVGISCGPLYMLHAGAEPGTGIHRPAVPNGVGHTASTARSTADPGDPIHRAPTTSWRMP